MTDEIERIRSSEALIISFESDYPELFYKVGKGRLSPDEPMYGAIIETQGGSPVGKGESDVSLAAAFEAALTDAGISAQSNEATCPFCSVPCLDCGSTDTPLVRLADAEARATAAEATVTALQEKLRLAEEALEPYANFDTEDFPDAMRAFEDDPDLTIGHFRRARKALTTIQETSP